MRAIGFGLTVAMMVATGQAAAGQYELLLSQPQAEQERILRAAITSAGHPCPQVTATLFKGADRDDAGYWAAACSDGGNWMVQIMNNSGGSMKVTSCKILKAVNVECWAKF